MMKKSINSEQLISSDNRANYCSEQRLLMAILLDAIHEATRGKRGLDYTTAVAWLSNLVDEHTGTMVWVCEHLNISPQYIYQMVFLSGPTERAAIHADSKSYGGAPKKQRTTQKRLQGNTAYETKRVHAS